MELQRLKDSGGTSAACIFGFQKQITCAMKSDGKNISN